MADADLVLEGGGVKGSGLVGAVTALAEHGDPFSFHRIAGTSAGAIVAGCRASGMSAAQVKDVMDKLDFSQFEDESGILGHVPGLGQLSGLMLRLPWDYESLLGVDPDTVPVADAIRASAAIPFFFRPRKMLTNPAVTGPHSG